ncbi:MAG: dephospho-CoA kinase [Myxococcales bacterium]|nr:dephospho-CoA kinase [Myxococcales bacterium]
MTTTCKIIGLTGGIGSGKSLVRSYFAQLGIAGLDADLVARELHQDPAHPVVAEIAEFFPNTIGEDGRLQRGSLRTFFAQNQAANRQLMAILRPHCLAHMRLWTAQQCSRYVIWESALLSEAAIAVDRVLVVDTEPQAQVARVRLRNPDWSVEHIEAVMALQVGRKERLALADDVILNTSSLQDLRQRVDELHNYYLRLWT